VETCAEYAQVAQIKGAPEKVAEFMRKATEQANPQQAKEQL